MAKERSKKQAVKKTSFVLRYPYLILVFVAVVLYYPSVNNGFTELDDRILIIENENYNKDASNFSHSFKRGVFSEDKDTYFRPILLNSFILNYQFSKTEIKGYHLFNILLHVISVLLLFFLLQLIFQNKVKALLLSLLFAVHPVLTQAVAWVPGRNDSLLFIFSIAYLIAIIKYQDHKKPIWLVAQFLGLMLALFTKETAVFVAPAAIVLAISFDKFQWKSKSAIFSYLIVLISGLLWFAVRSKASIQNDPLVISDLIGNMIHRSPLLLQYLGKIILPINLNVFPMMEETSYLFGFIGLALLIGLLVLSKGANWKKVIGGFLWFGFILFPVLLLPATINNQDFEHRLYLPMIGILIVIAETALFTRLKEKQLTTVVLAICAVFAFITYKHQSNFSDPLTFWKSAVKNTPSSSYATMMLAARIDDEDLDKANELMLRAYELNPDEKYVNYYLGRMMLSRDSLDKAAQYFERELELSAYYETYLFISQVEFMRKNLNKSIEYMEVFLEKQPGNSSAIVNYTLMLLDTGQVEKAKAFIKQKQNEGVQLPAELVQKVNQS